MVAVLGVVTAGLQTNADGFLGDAVIRVDPPTGASSATVIPTTAIITPVLMTEVAKITLDPLEPGHGPSQYRKLPTITISDPPNLSKFVGWFGVRFNPGDAFEFVIQYTIAKAISFQVDPDSTLPGYYFIADSITIGGV
jgi:hypothetical protein